MDNSNLSEFKSTNVTIKDRSISDMLTLCLFIVKYSDLVVNPLVAIVGLVGNTLSMVILVKSGLHKPSNILLLGLAVADFVVLLDPLNVPRFLLYLSPIELYWNMSLNSINICYKIYILCTFIVVIAAAMSVTLTTFITLERIIAVYFPLRFSRLITQKRAVFAVIFAACAPLPLGVVMQFKYQLGVAYSKSLSSWLGGITAEPKWVGSDMELYYNIVSNYIVPFIPTILVTVGCLLISVKIHTTIRQRKKMMVSSRNRPSSSRTKTVLLVCFAFSFTQISQQFAYLPQLSNMSSLSTTLFLTMIYTKIVNSLVYFNGACNFFIYVIFNPKFRKLLTEKGYKTSPKQ